MPFQAHCLPRDASTFDLRHAVTRAALAGALTLTLSGPLCARTVDAPPITIDGMQSSVHGVQENNSTFVPIRSVFDKIGAKVTFAPPSLVKATKNGAEIARLTVGSRNAVLMGSPRQLAAAPFRANGTVMVPLRFLSEAAGASVAYTASPRSVQVTRASAAVAGVGAASNVVAATGAAATGTPAATDTAQAVVSTAAADTQTNHAGIPWWVWLLAALIVIGIVFALLRRKKEPLITTSGTVGGGPVIKTRH